MRILIVEDDPAVANGLCKALRKELYAVDHASDGETAAELHDINDYDLVVLDRSIPPPTGMELLEQWRKEGDATPVLMLTGHASVEDRVGGLDQGADDYLTKPYSLEELLARVRSLLRRKGRPLLSTLSIGSLAMHRPSRKVTVGEDELKLTPKEFALLEYLLMRKAEVVTRTELAEHVWDDTFDVMSNSIDVLIHRIRKKISIDEDAPVLETVVGVGYALKERS